MEGISENTRIAQTQLISRIPKTQQGHHDTDAYEMISNLPILPHSEVFNTYGETLTNAQLLAQYGFVLDANENDSITWEINELRDFAGAYSARFSDPACCGHVDRLMEVWRGIIQIWPDDARWLHSDLVYSLGTTARMDTETTLLQADNGHGPDLVLELNGDARIAHHLWIYCAVLGLDSVESGRERFNAGTLPKSLGPELDNTVGVLGQVADLQVAIEAGRPDEDGGVYISEQDKMLPGGAFTDRDIPDPAVRRSLTLPTDKQRDPSLYSRHRETLLAVLSRTIHTVESLCNSRKDCIGKKGADSKSIQELGEFVDVSRVVGI
jgi:hypothetical protein